jgi:hypothetical protein
MNSRQKVMVDFTSTSHGRVRAPIERVFGSAEVGQAEVGQFVLAFDPDDDLCADALVSEIKGRFIYLSVEWETQRDLSAELSPINSGSPSSGVIAQSTTAPTSFVVSHHSAILV